MTGLWRYDELCEYLQCAPSTAKKRVRRGDIPSILIGRLRRFDPERVKQHLNRNEADANREPVAHHE